MAAITLTDLGSPRVPAFRPAGFVPGFVDVLWAPDFDDLTGDGWRDHGDGELRIGLYDPAGRQAHRGECRIEFHTSSLLSGAPAPKLIAPSDSWAALIAGMPFLSWFGSADGVRERSREEMIEVLRGLGFEDFTDISRPQPERPRPWPVQVRTVSASRPRRGLGVRKAAQPCIIDTVRQNYFDVLKEQIPWDITLSITNSRGVYQDGESMMKLAHENGDAAVTYTLYSESAPAVVRQMPRLLTWMAANDGLRTTRVDLCRQLTRIGFRDASDRPIEA
jgi:hypothetical protein